MKEFTINKPASITGYPIHRAVAALAQGTPHIWRDNGQTLTVRTTVLLGADGLDLPSVSVDELRMFSLRACVSSKVRGRHIYAARGDHVARKKWLDRQGERHGFEVVAVHCTSDAARVTDQSGRNFTLDSTDFTGVLKVIDVEAFQAALRTGVGSTGKAFGFSLLSI